MTYPKMFVPETVQGYPVIASRILPTKPGRKDAMVVMVDLSGDEDAFEDAPFAVWYFVPSPMGSNYQDYAYGGEISLTMSEANEEFDRLVELEDPTPNAQDR